jgi:prepilin peptidase CpaA
MPRRREPPLRRFRADPRGRPPSIAGQGAFSHRVSETGTRFNGFDPSPPWRAHLFSRAHGPVGVDGPVDLHDPKSNLPSLALGYLVLAAPLGVPAADILLNLSCALAILALAFVMFNLGWVGGGDAKLAAATAIWLGWSSILDYGLAAAICGGLLTLVILGARMAPLPPALARFAWVARLHDCKSGVPYGIALAAAGLMQYPSSGIWAAAVYKGAPIGFPRHFQASQA